jgi:RNA ligase (TIGR02306 family)
MSKLIVEVCTVDKVEPHPTADRLKVATVKGWRTCIGFDPVTGRTQFQPGDKCIFFPPDSILPPEIANAPTDNPPGRLNVMRFLAMLPQDGEGRTPPGGRVRAARLQGYPSYGVIMNVDPSYGDDPNWPVGTDLREYFHVTKWTPPPCTDADAAPDHPLFHRYTDIQSYGNFPLAIPRGRKVVFKEKIHGQNSRIGLVLDGGEDPSAQPEWQLMVGSFDVRRYEIDKNGKRSPYWEALPPQAIQLLEYVRDKMTHKSPVQSIILFGERFGMQDMKYGLPSGALGYRAFDIAVNGFYLDYEVKQSLFAQFGIAEAPTLWCGPFSPEELEKWTNGETTLAGADKLGKFKGREGIVITPVVEEFSPILGDRMILKSVSVDYLNRKGAKEEIR